MSKPKTKKRLLGWDIETSFSVVTTFALKTDYIHHSNIMQDWNILTAAWKFFDGGKVQSIRVKNPHDDYDICLRLRELLDDDIILIHHNGDKFDLKKLNTRLVYHGIDPLPTKILTLDTLKAAKKHFSFTSNRLDYLGQFLGIGKKIETSSGLWRRVLEGDKKALIEMERYNRGDVDPLLEGVYNRLLPYIDHPNMGAFYEDGRMHCKNCGSEKLIKHKTRITRDGTAYQQYQFKDCHAFSSERKSISKTVLK